MVKKSIFSLFFLLITIVISAQDLDIRNLQREIKTSGNYCYGDGLSETYEEAEDFAWKELQLMITEELRVQFSENKEVTVEFQDIKDSIKHLAIPLQGMTRVVSYINKNDFYITLTQEGVYSDNSYETVPSIYTVFLVGKSIENHIFIDESHELISDEINAEEAQLQPPIIEEEQPAEIVIVGNKNKTEEDSVSNALVDTLQNDLVGKNADILKEDFVAPAKTEVFEVQEPQADEAEVAVEDSEQQNENSAPSPVDESYLNLSEEPIIDEVKEEVPVTIQEIAPDHTVSEPIIQEIMNLTLSKDVGSLLNI